MGFLTEGEALSGPAVMIGPFLKQAISGVVTRILASNRSTPRSSSGSTESWMTHLTPEEKKNWSLVIDRDVKRQQKVRPRPQSRAYSSGRNSKKRRVSAPRKFNLDSRITQAIERVNGQSSSSSSQAQNVVQQMRTNEFRKAYSNQMRNDVSQRLAGDADFKNEPNSSRYKETKEWLSRQNAGVMKSEKKGLNGASNDTSSSSMNSYGNKREVVDSKKFEAQYEKLDDEDMID